MGLQLDVATALDQLDAERPDTGGGVERLARLLGVPPGTRVDDAARRTAIVVVTATQTAMASGSGSVMGVRAGVRAAKVLTSRPSRLNTEAVRLAMGRALAGGPPAWLIGDMDDDEIEEDYL